MKAVNMKDKSLSKKLSDNKDSIIGVKDILKSEGKDVFQEGLHISLPQNYINKG